MSELSVVLIGGPPGAGKTTLGKSLAAALGFLATTVDDLVTTARAFTDARSQPDLHRASGVGHLAYFTEGPPERLIDDASALSDAMWPVLERVMQRHTADKHPVVFDWWLFDPDRVATLSEGTVSNGAIRSVWLHVDPSELDRRERRVTEFRAGSPDPDQMHAHFMARSLWRNELIHQRATALGLPVLHQPGDKSVDDLTREALQALGVAG